MSINNILYNTATPIYSCIVYSCFGATKAELTSCNRDPSVWPTRLKHLLSGPLQKKFVTP